jgi:predicted unusual protein kinase regulating ubiquinone biosynthesis (AarF/ABC1/UbiB family)
VLADELFRAYLDQILVHGFFHADPHPGNVLITTDGRLALIDLGMVARLVPRMQDSLLQILLAISEGRGDEAAALAERMGRKAETYDAQTFRRSVGDLVARHETARLKDIQVGKIVLQITHTSAECGIRAPRELTMLGKALLNLDEVARTLDPDFDPNEKVRERAAEVMRERLKQSLSPGNIFSSMLELKEFAERLPRRVNDILDRVANNEMTLRVDTIDEKYLMEGFQKIANRITTGLVLAALIIAGALVMRIETAWTLFGYPGLAIILFLAACAGGFWLVITILFRDEHASRRARKPVERPRV